MEREDYRSLLYYPDRLPADLPPPVWAADAEEVWMRAADGVRIHGLWWPGPEGRPAVLFLHGNAQEVYSWSPVREDLAAMECGLLLVDYRGYGKSEGAPGEEGLYADGRAAMSWLEQRGLPAGRTVVFGKSLGGAVACEIATDRPVMGLVLESTFTSLASVARNLFPFAGWMPDMEVYDSQSKLPGVHSPVLVVHGDRDALIPVEEGLALFRSANEPKELLVVEGAGHNDVSMSAGAGYGRALRSWLNGVAGPALL